jgi:hypothetical protein
MEGGVMLMEKKCLIILGGILFLPPVGCLMAAAYLIFSYLLKLPASSGMRE